MALRPFLFLQGYLKLSTSHGDLNIELHCDIAPRACQNFLARIDCVQRPQPHCVTSLVPSVEAS